MSLALLGALLGTPPSCSLANDMQTWPNLGTAGGTSARASLTARSVQLLLLFVDLLLSSRWPLHSKILTSMGAKLLTMVSGTPGTVRVESVFPHTAGPANIPLCFSAPGSVSLRDV